MGALVEFSLELAKDGLSVQSLLGLPSILGKYGGMPISYLMEHGFKLLRSNYILIPKQKTKVAILMILASTILANWERFN